METNTLLDAVDEAERAPFPYGEVQIFRETVRLEVALLETGAPLEDPRGVQLGMGRDPPEEPAEDVVLLDDVFSKQPLSGSPAAPSSTNSTSPGYSRNSQFARRLTDSASLTSLF